VEQSYFANSGESSAALAEFWLRELRTPELLVEVAAAHRKQADVVAADRPAAAAALRGETDRIQELLDAEEKNERRRDREYWEPLKRELEQLRLARAKLSRGLEPRLDPGLE
jgi:hypothetical protein